MKFCSRPWDFWYLIDAEDGQVWPCPWFYTQGFNIGNIHEQSVEEIQSSQDLKKLQQSIVDGSYCYCNRNECAFLANDTLPDLTEEQIQEITKQQYPDHFNIAYDETCNHACPSCRKSIFKAPEGYYDKVRAINKKMLPYYNKAKYISVNGRGDIFACKDLLELLSEIRPEREDFELVIETNAALFDADHWKWIDHLSNYRIRVTLTVNSFVDSTYRYLSGYANHVDKVIDNLQFIHSLKKQGKINSITMSMIVQEANFRELPTYIKRCLSEFGADFVRVRGIMQFDMGDQEFWFKDVFNPAHPNYSEAMEILDDPIFKDERVWCWEGDYKTSRAPIENPYEKFRIYYDLLWKMIDLEEANNLTKVFEDYRDKTIAVYGAGHIGTFVAKRLQKYGYSLKGIYDQHADRKEPIDNIVLIKADQSADFSGIDVVINTIDAYQESVKKYLHDRNYSGQFISLSELIH